MSGIFGILNLEGQPVSRQHLEAMQAGMAYWGTDGSSIWQADTTGLGHLLLRNTPEAHYESLPHQDPNSGVVITAHARIDNREELIADLRALDTHNPQSKIVNPESKIPDSALLLQAYLRWGEGCVHHHLGDWAFAVWDPHRRKLFLARDHHGISGIYYYCHPGLFAFASSIKGLLALPQAPKRPNLFRVAQVLTSWPGDGVQTAYEGVLRLPPAHTLTVTADRVEVRRYWSLDDLSPLRLKSDGEYLEAFLEVYTNGHKKRRVTS